MRYEMVELYILCYVFLERRKLVIFQKYMAISRKRYDYMDEYSHYTSVRTMIYIVVSIID